MDPSQGPSLGEDGTAGDLAGLSASASPLEVPSEPALREDQIQNAVSFLSHPKVRGSAESAKRTFLEKKGLTAAEIDEAFKRVPPEAPAAPAAAATSSTPTVGANNLVTYTQQPQQAMQAPQHMPQVPSQALVPAQQMQMMQPQRPPVHWSQVVLGLGVAAAGVYGLHQLLAPRLTAWSHQLFSSRKAAAEAEAERTAALTAALERLSEGQSRLQETLESLTAAVKQQQQQRGFAESQADYLACQSPSLGKMPQHQQQQQVGAGLGSSYYGRDGPQTMDTYASSSRAAAMRGGSSWDPYAPDSSYRPASEGRPGSATSPSGRNPAATAGGPSGFYGSSATGFEVTPPPMGNYRAPQPPAQYGGSSANKTAGPSGVDPGYARRAGAYAGPEESASASATARPEEAPRSAAFHEVMAMVQAGITPPNVRTDIDDNPPDPSRPLSAPQMPPRTKPWEAGTVSNNGLGTPGAAFSSNVVADGPNGFGVRGYGGSAGPVTPTSAPHAGSGGPASTGAASAAGDIGTGAAAAKPAVGYDLSQLLGVDATRDAPWRPPPPPAATVQRPVSRGSTTKQQLAGAESAPPAATAQAERQPEPLLAAASAPPVAAAVAADAAPAVPSAAAVVEAADDPLADNVQQEA